MKSVSVAAAAAVLAGVSMAQPHGHHGHQHQHAKRELVTTWETVWETVTLIVDESTTETILPTPTGTGAPGEFFQPPSSSTPETQPTIAETPTVVETPTVQAPTTTSTPEPAPTTTVAAPPPPPPAPTTTSTPEPAPAPTTVEAPAPPPAPPASSSSAPAPDSGSGSGSSSGGGQEYSGDITFYTVGLGACGYDDTGMDDSKPIVAIARDTWNAVSTLTNSGLNQPSHPWCGKTIKITASNGKTATGVIRDQCPGCSGGSIDTSTVLFESLYDLGVGRGHVTWEFA
ncbi:hypothetical protein F5Y19DRAFT_317022 [Xylariaceae sp. FL1651]|nr:hypothetical protein F5Y19DRAFT_317022 [Xylariaceae sp. FL1651]